MTGVYAISSFCLRHMQFTLMARRRSLLSNPITKAYNVSLGKNIKKLSVTRIQCSEGRTQSVFCRIMDGDQITTFTVDPAAYQALQAKLVIRSEPTSTVNASSTCNPPNTRRQVYARRAGTNKESPVTICVTSGTAFVHFNCAQVRVLRIDDADDSTAHGHTNKQSPFDVRDNIARHKCGVQWRSHCSHRYCDCRLVQCPWLCLLQATSQEVIYCLLSKFSTHYRCTRSEGEHYKDITSTDGSSDPWDNDVFPAVHIFSMTLNNLMCN